MLSKQDERRAMVLGQVSAGLLGIAEAAALIGVSERQVRRLLADERRVTEGTACGQTLSHPVWPGHG